MANTATAVSASRPHAAILNEAASRYAIYGVFIASGALIIATLLVAWLSDGSVTVEAIADAQRQNIALWCMDAMPFIFALWGQYASSRMAREADNIISARTRVFQEALEEAQLTNQAKTDFFARISHELRTPLNAIVGMADMLVDAPSPGDARWYAQTVRESAQNLLTLINDILDIAKIEAGRMELEKIEFDLRECVRGAMSLLDAQARHKGLKLTSLVVPEIPVRAIGDPGRLRQIIINLVGNAIKYTNEGEVVFTLSRSGAPDAAHLELRIEVADTGIGIPAAAQRDLFKPYRQVGGGASRRGGTGLGLAITRELVESMHGNIGVESKAGKGSKFWCTLHLSKATQPRVAAPDRHVSLEHRRVLIADPNESSRQALALQLRTLGMQVESAADSDEAIASVQSALREKRPFDIIVLDMFLTKLNGEELGQHLLANPATKEALVAMITSAGARGDVERMAREGFSAYLTRPLSPEDLKPLFQQILSLHKLSPEERRRTGVITRHSHAGSERISDEPRKRVLLVEDSEAGRAVGLRQLARLGLVADVALSGEEALDAARRTRYGVILLDLQLPDMSGTQVLRRLRANVGSKEELPVVITTAGATDAEHRQCRELGANRILTKPIDTHELRSVLAEWLDPATITDAGRDRWAPAHPQSPDRELVEIFLRESDLRMDAIRNAPPNQQGRLQVARDAHTLSSTSQYVGDSTTSLAAKRVESLARSGDMQDLAPAVEQLIEAYGTLRKRLQENSTTLPASEKKESLS